MIGRQGTFRLALLSTLLSQLLVVGTASAHGGAGSSVFRRYDELLTVAAVPFVLMLVVGLLHYALPARRDDRGRKTQPTGFIVGRSVRPPTRARNR